MGTREESILWHWWADVLSILYEGNGEKKTEIKHTASSMYLFYWSEIKKLRDFSLWTPS